MRDDFTSFGFRCAAILLFIGVGHWGGSARGEQGMVSYTRDIVPILSNHCYACHGPDGAQRKGEFRLDLKSSAFAGGESGLPAIVPENPDSSQLLIRIFSSDPDELMPPADHERPLSATQKNLLRQWIANGAPWEDHWAFAQPQAPNIPDIPDNPNFASFHPVNPIDYFAASRMAEEGLSPSRESEGISLIRRVTLDLTGLPPTPEAVEAFVNDPSPDAYEKAVDRLMRSAHYGEHMARFWLDAVRYGDTHGLHLDNYREMWPYRDWVIDAFNNNTPYDRFTIDQLAGDLLENPTTDQLVATGFNRCHVTTGEGGSITEEVFIRNVVERVVGAGTVFMGLTMDCTRCHDHKFDPLTMDDFYSMSAFFNSLDGNPLDGNRKDHAPFIKVPNPSQSERMASLQSRLSKAKVQFNAPWQELDDSQLAWESAQLNNSPDTSNSSQWKKPDVPKNINDILAVKPGERKENQKQQLRDFFRRSITTNPDMLARVQLLDNLTKQVNDLNAQIPITLVWKEKANPVPAHILKRGEYNQKGRVVKRNTPSFLPPMDPEYPKDRLGLALWLTDGNNPLTARVAVNRIWQQFFGTGIVKTSEDFGRQASPPTHPKLLDWLAEDFIESGWNVKNLVKTIVMSATYRQSSEFDPAQHAMDPHNRFLHRGARYRLDAEMIRDQSLMASGMLSLRVGGPPVKPPQPDGLWFAVGFSRSDTVRFVADTDPEKTHRRSLYTFLKRTSPPPQLTTFDGPSREACVMRRERTNTPMQALLLMNDPQFVETHIGLAKHALSHFNIQSDLSDPFKWMFRQALLRNPSPIEMDILNSAYAEQLEYFSQNPESASKFLSTGIFSSDSFTDPVSAAALGMVAGLILNTDEILNKN